MADDTETTTTGDDFPSIGEDLRQNYAEIVAQRGITYADLAASVDETGDKTLAAYLRSQSQPADQPPQERQAAPTEIAAPPAPDAPAAS